MASTIDLDAVIGHALPRGTSVRLIGDDQQLASISAGGVLRDLADRHDAVTLNADVHFTHPQTGRAEGAASLALRASEPADIGFYIDHHRVHVGTDALAADTRYATAATWQSSTLPISTANRLPGCDCQGVPQGFRGN